MSRKRIRRERPAGRRYPTPEELITLFVAGPPAERMDEVTRLAQTYGIAEVQAVLESFQKGTQRPFIYEESWLYRDYRLAFARFGGERRFLSKRELEELTFEEATRVAKRKWRPLLRRGPDKRERELRHLLLGDERLWDDIMPPAPPPRPPNFPVPPAGAYPARLEELLRLGWKADEQAIAARARQAGKWKPFIPDLERMVLDEGLLSGWPADPPAWAPLHALRLLGYLRAHQSAGRLMALMDRENDWLSDLLPSVWAEMGPQVAEPLWAYILDRQHDPEQRGNVMVGLQELAEKYPHYRREVVAGLAQLLDDAPVDDSTANAYVVHVLGELRATEALPAITRAYDTGKVDLEIMTWDDVMSQMEKA
jgi:hypothetical protein